MKSRFFCRLSLSILAIFTLAKPISATVISIRDVPLGKVIAIGSQNFVKISHTGLGGGQFLALSPVPICELEKINYLQDFTRCACTKIPLPACVAASNCATSTTITDLYTTLTDPASGQPKLLLDKRDGRSYEIRKYADGQCWMADDLKFGDTTISDFSNLDKIYGGSGINNQYDATHARTYFWGIPNSIASLDVGWKGTYPGCSGDGACLSTHRGTHGAWYSSATGLYLVVLNNRLLPTLSNPLGFAFQVRCIAD